MKGLGEPLLAYVPKNGSLDQKDLLALIENYYTNFPKGSINPLALVM